jgi:hypothetical protein
LNPFAIALCAGFALVVTSSCAWALDSVATHPISDIRPIALKTGVNEVANFADDGRLAIIVKAWRENMNAHGYANYEVLLPRPGTNDDWNLVTFDNHVSVGDGASQVDNLSDAPFDGENVVAAVRILKARYQDKLATLAITARRDMAKATSFIDKLSVQFSIYKLVSNADGIPGWPFDYFDRVDAFKSKRGYCNADLALKNELNLPLPANYAGANNTDGCIR